MSRLDCTMQMTEGGARLPVRRGRERQHHRRAEFAAAINDYDTECNGEPYPADEQWDEDWIGHAWVTVDEDGERLHPCPADTPGAIAVTTLWGQR